MYFDDVNEEIGFYFESEDFDIIGGYVFGLFGWQLKYGEWFEYVGFQFNIVEMDGK